MGTSLLNNRIIPLAMKAFRGRRYCVSLPLVMADGAASQRRDHHTDTHKLIKTHTQKKTCQLCHPWQRCNWLEFKIWHSTFYDIFIMIWDQYRQTTELPLSDVEWFCFVEILCCCDRVLRHSCEMDAAVIGRQTWSTDTIFIRFAAPMCSHCCYKTVMWWDTLLLLM